MENPTADGEEAQSSCNWSEAVEDLVATGETEAAISLLETTVSKLENQESTNEPVNLQLASALTNLANLYSSKGFSLKSDELLARAFQIRDAKVVNKDLKDSWEDSAHNRPSNDGSLYISFLSV
ncbi:hypothetical protein Patl1_30302 [Pistacia atlantica]|uniref:Uncharacterized protein n=1 Tax=Pistacia atlantica TaxID=434234 RepID=A0ACC1A9Y5_9ROSI|nr:hypothetical protein Patl1_30302 [Pistacia atlantica]